MVLEEPEKKADLIARISIFSRQIGRWLFPHPYGPHLDAALRRNDRLTTP
jgi:hypothetical protein